MTPNCRGWGGLGELTRAATHVSQSACAGRAPSGFAHACRMAGHVRSAHPGTCHLHACTRVLFTPLRVCSARPHKSAPCALTFVLCTPVHVFCTPEHVCSRTLMCELTAALHVCSAHLYTCALHARHVCSAGPCTCALHTHTCMLFTLIPVFCMPVHVCSAQPYM